MARHGWSAWFLESDHKFRFDFRYVTQIYTDTRVHTHSHHALTYRIHTHTHTLITNALSHCLSISPRHRAYTSGDTYTRRRIHISETLANITEFCSDSANQWRTKYKSRSVAYRYVYAGNNDNTDNDLFATGFFFMPTDKHTHS